MTAPRSLIQQATITRHIFVSKLVNARYPQVMTARTRISRPQIRFMRQLVWLTDAIFCVAFGVENGGDCLAAIQIGADSPVLLGSLLLTKSVRRLGATPHDNPTILVHFSDGAFGSVHMVCAASCVLMATGRRWRHDLSTISVFSATGINNEIILTRSHASSLPSSNSRMAMR